MAIPGQYSVKSFGLNAATTLLFLTPFLLYFFGHFTVNEMPGTRIIGIANVVMLAIAWFIPPRGWKRPHPYSDQAHLRQS